jgi:hypothetical protein
MDPDTYREKLRTLYANYFEGWRNLFGLPGGVPRTPVEEREQRWEGEGGRTTGETPDPDRTR